MIPKMPVLGLDPRMGTGFRIKIMSKQNGAPLCRVTGAARYSRTTLRPCRKLAERWQSGRMHRTRNAAYGQPYRGFESLPLRHTNEINHLEEVTSDVSDSN
jgi:hypothetical protein